MVCGSTAAGKNLHAPGQTVRSSADTDPVLSAHRHQRQGVDDFQFFYRASTETSDIRNLHDTSRRHFCLLPPTSEQPIADSLT